MGLLNPATVVRHLKRRDKILGGILRETDQCPLFDQRVLSEEALFQRLARSIVGQQLSTRAASTIWGRVVAPARGRGGLRRRILNLTEGQAAKAALGDHSPAGYRQRSRFYSISDEGRLLFACNVARYILFLAENVGIAGATTCAAARSELDTFPTFAAFHASIASSSS